MSASGEQRVKTVDVEPIETFLEEAEDRLDAITDVLTLLETSMDDSDENDRLGPTEDLVRAMFRDFHSIKGAASFLDFDEIVQTAHGAEDLLQEVRDNQLPLDRSTRMALTQSVRNLYQLLRKPRSEFRTGFGTADLPPGQTAAPDGPESHRPGPTESPGSDSDPEEAMVGLDDVILKDARRRSETLSSLIAQTVPLHITESRRELLPYVVLDLEQTVHEALESLKCTGSECSEKANQQLVESCKDLRNVLTYFGSATLECDLDVVELAVESIPSANKTRLAQLRPRLRAIFEVMLLRLSRLSEERDLLLYVDPLRHRLRALSEGRSLPGEAELPPDATLADVYRVDGIQVRAEPLQSPSASEPKGTPTQFLVQRLKKLTDNLSQLTQRPVRFETEVEDTDLSASLLGALSGPLAQIIRNSIDHGIENTADRKAAGKADVGTITLSITEESDQVVVSVGDDGRGIDGDEVAERARKRGLISADAIGRLSTEEKLRLILLPGLSTRNEVSTLSGRGVGMDLVVSDVRQLGGSLSIESTPTVGSRFILRIPSPGQRLWTFTIDGVLYGIPCESVEAVEPIDRETSPSSWQSEQGSIARMSLCELLTDVAGNATFTILMGRRVGKQIALTVPLEPNRERIPTQPLPATLLPGPGELVHAVGASTSGSVCLVLDPSHVYALATERRNRALHVGANHKSPPESS